MPTLVPITIWWPFTLNGSSSKAMIRSAKSAASAGLSIGARTTANSPPPRRATMSMLRVRAPSRPSGVVLAALKLLASYRLASLGYGDLSQANQLTIETGHLALKSSVTGLFIQRSPWHFSSCI